MFVSYSKRMCDSLPNAIDKIQLVTPFFRGTSKIWCQPSHMFIHAWQSHQKDMHCGALIHTLAVKALEADATDPISGKHELSGFCSRLHGSVVLHCTNIYSGLLRMWRGYFLSQRLAMILCAAFRNTIYITLINKTKPCAAISHPEDLECLLVWGGSIAASWTRFARIRTSRFASSKDACSSLTRLQAAWRLCLLSAGFSPRRALRWPSSFCKGQVRILWPRCLHFLHL